jgi:4-hydroxy-tetrahydrodipicolinate synthase
MPYNGVGKMKDSVVPNAEAGDMQDLALFSAVGTPLTPDETLHIEGFERHLADQWRAGMTGVLIGGTMGLMQLLSDATYRQLVEHGVRACAGHGETMIGAGDASFARTRDRIKFLNEHRLDGVVVLAPYLWKFSQEELVDYFAALADLSRSPLYLYDLPVLTGTKLTFETVLAIAKHPNVRGIKCSCEFGWTRQLIDIAPKGFRVIAAQADLLDVLLRHGVTQHIDGIFALAPDWTVAIARAAGAGDWDAAAALQQKLSALLRVLRDFGIFPSFTALLNARGIPGNYGPAPMRPLNDERRAALLAAPIVRELLAADRDPKRASSNGDGMAPSSGAAAPAVAHR